MRRLVLAPRAKKAVETILNDSADRFGIAASERYRKLLEAAFQDVCERPDGSVLSKVVKTPSGFGLYPIRHSLRRIPKGERVRQPRHLLAFRFDDTMVVVLDVLDERMNLPMRFESLLSG